MGVNYPVPNEYEFEYFHNGSSSVLAATLGIALTPLNLNPIELFNWARKGESVGIPEAPGSIFLTDGFQDSVEMEFEGAADGLNPFDTFDYLRTRHSRFTNGAGIKYIRAGLWDGAQKIRYRRYGQPLSGGGQYARKTRYQAINRHSFNFLCEDPAWYYDSVVSDSFNVTSSTTGNKAVSDTGSWRSSRLIVFISRTAATPTNITIKNSDNQLLGITGTLPNNGDSWAIDMYAGTVTKTVSSVASNDIANMTGRFWGMQAGSDTITFTSTVSCSATISLFWLPRLT